MLSKRKADFHLSHLDWRVEEVQHITNPDVKKRKISNDLIWWSYADGSNAAVDDETLETFVNDGKVPEGVISIDFNRMFEADISTHREHLYSRCCVLQGKSFGGKLVHIKIAAKSCLGMREYNAAEFCTSGCMDIIALFQTASFNVFVREQPIALLSDLLIDEDDEVDARKIIIDIAKTINHLHENQTFVRFIIPENIAVVEEGRAKFLEYNTLKFSKEKMEADGEADSGNELAEEFPRMVNPTTINNLNSRNITDKSYNVKNEYALLGELIQELSIFPGHNDLSFLSQDVKDRKYSLDDLVAHPLLQSVDECYFNYISTLVNIFSGKGPDTISSFNNWYNSAYEHKTWNFGAFGRHAVSVLNELLEKEHRINLMALMLNASNAYQKLHIINILHARSQEIVDSKQMNEKFRKNRKLFLKELRIETSKFIAQIHNYVAHNATYENAATLFIKQED